MGSGWRIHAPWPRIRCSGVRIRVDPPLAVAQDEVDSGGSGSGEWLARPTSPRTSCSVAAAHASSWRRRKLRLGGWIRLPHARFCRPYLSPTPMPWGGGGGGGGSGPSALPPFSFTTGGSLLSYIDKEDLERPWTDWGLLGLDLSAAHWSSARRRSLGYSDPIWVVLQRRGAHGSAAGVPAVGHCALRVCAGANCGTLARFGRGLAGGGASCSWAPSRLLLGKAQRSLVTATTSTSATSWVIACCWSAGVRLPSHGRVQQWANGSVWCGGDRLPSSGRLLAGARLHPSRASPGVAPARCGGDRHVWGFLVGARLPPPRASPGAAPRGVAAADTPSVQARTLLPPRRGRVRHGSALSGGG